MKNRTLVLVVVILFALTQYAGLVPLRAGYNQQVGQEKYPTDSKHMLSSSTWLSGWDFRKAHVITGSAGAGTNYQIEIIVRYGSGSDSGPNVYCNHNCQPSFDDVRFTGDDGVSLLHSWREEVVASDHAVFWVKITDDLSSDVSIYVYYGNPTAVNTNAGDSTFIFFDDFESGVFDLGKWENPGDWQIVTTNVRDGSYAAYCHANASHPTLLCNLTSKNLNYGFTLHVWFRFGANSGLTGVYPGLFRSSTGQQVCSVMVYCDLFCYNHGGGPYLWPGSSLVYSKVYYRMELGFDFQSNKQRCWENRSSIGQLDLWDVLGHSVSRIIYYCPAAGNYSGGDMWLDNCYIRKWIPSEPQHGAWGVEVMLRLSHPADVQMNETDTGQSITWILSGSYPVSYQVRRNGTLIASGPWNSTGEHITVSLNGIVPGVHVYNATIIDFGGDSASDIVVVTVDRVSGLWQASGTMIVITVGALAVIVVLSGLICRLRR